MTSEERAKLLQSIKEIVEYECIVYDAHYSTASRCMKYIAALPFFAAPSPAGPVAEVERDWPDKPGGWLNVPVEGPPGYWHFYICRPDKDSGGNHVLINHRGYSVHKESANTTKDSDAFFIGRRWLPCTVAVPAAAPAEERVERPPMLYAKCPDGWQWWVRINGVWLYEKYAYHSKTITSVDRALSDYAALEIYDRERAREEA